MAILKMFNKEKIPDELPELISDKIDPENNKNIKSLSKKKKNRILTKIYDQQINKIQKKDQDEKKISELKNESSKEIKINEKTKQGLFNELEGYLKKDIENLNNLEKIHTLKINEDLNQLEKWYNHRIKQGDIIKNIKKYWEDQTQRPIIETLGKNIQDKISEKKQRLQQLEQEWQNILNQTSKLQQLEKEWQNIYFELIEKESKIKESEVELKTMIESLSEKCRNHIE
jgi:hypothetical protein